MLPCINKIRFPPIWICCVGDYNDNIIKSGPVKEVLGPFSFKDCNNITYELENLNSKHIPSNPLRWSFLPDDFDEITTLYLTQELQIDSLASQIIQSHYYNELKTKDGEDEE